MWESFTRVCLQELVNSSTAMETGRRSLWRLEFAMAGEGYGGGPHGGWSATWQVRDTEEVLMEAGVRHGR